MMSLDDETQEVKSSGQEASSQNLQASKGAAYGFYGAFNHSIDTKGRLIVPQPFRDRLGEKIVVGVNMAQSSIAIGIKLELATEAGTGYSGPVYLDSVDW